MPCLTCNDTGYVWATKKQVNTWDISGPEVFRCPCRGADKLKKNVWGPHRARTHILESELQSAHVHTIDEQSQKEQVEDLSLHQEPPALSPSLYEKEDFTLNEAWVIEMINKNQTQDPLFTEALKKYGRDCFTRIFLEHRNQKTSLSMQGNESRRGHENA